MDRDYNGMSESTLKFILLFSLAMSCSACGSMSDGNATNTNTDKVTESPTETAETLALTAEAYALTETPTQTRTAIPIIMPNDYSTGWPNAGYDNGKTYWNRMEDTLFPPLEKRWEYPQPNKNIVFVGTPLISSGRIVLFTNLLGTPKSEVYILDAKSGGFITSVVSENLSPLIAGGILFYGQESNICSLRLDTISNNCFAVGKDTPGFGIPMIYRNHLLILNDKGITSYDLDAEMEAETIYGTIEGYYFIGPLIDNGVLLLTAIEYSGKEKIIQAIDIENKTLLWEKHSKIEDENPLDTQLASDGILFSKPGNGDVIQAYSARDGTLIWERTFSYTFSGRMAVMDQILYVAENNYLQNKVRTKITYPMLYAIDIYTGEIIAQRRGLSDIISLAGANHILYASAARDGVYALDPKTLDTLWEDHCYCPGYLGIADGQLFLTAMRLMIAYENIT